MDEDSGEAGRGVSDVAGRKRRRGLSTRAVHAGETSPPPPWLPVVAPIFQTAPWSFASVAELEAAYADERGTAIYSRQGNPTVRVLEEKIAALEGADDAVAFASGMAALATTLASVVPAGGRLLAADELYGGSEALLAWWAARQPGIVIERRPLANVVERLDAELASDPDASRDGAPLAAVHLETPSNPLLACCDLAAVAERCRRLGRRSGRRVVLVVDGTFAPPPVQQALALGADLVIHSATKFLAGHSDVTAGVVAGGREDLAAIRHALTTTGGCLDPHAAFLVGRGVKTLSLRLARQVDNAERLASTAADHPAVVRLHWPGSDPIGRTQMTSGGSMLALELAGGAAAVVAFADAVGLMRIIPSLGGVESGISIPALTSHRGLDAEARRSRGIGDGLLRISCGIEDGDDLVEDLARGLDAARRAGSGDGAAAGDGG
ncbi:MAG TPA: PLP-dependent transferase [Thermoanaerobaculia bacterium]|nr:PLP-dependent transferase [Thermoanaerobaculia bacterium]